MKLTKPSELTTVLDVDLTAYLVYSGIPIARVSEEAGRIAFFFPAEAVAEKQTELASGRSRVEPCRWASIVRRIHQDYLSPSAKAALRNRNLTETGHGPKNSRVLRRPLP